MVCRHDAVTTWGDDAGDRMWSCSDCARRFYPACEVCVDVGHRNEVHVPDPLRPVDGQVGRPCPPGRPRKVGAGTRYDDPRRDAVLRRRLATMTKGDDR